METVKGEPCSETDSHHKSTLDSDPCGEESAMQNTSTVMKTEDLPCMDPLIVFCESDFESPGGNKNESAVTEEDNEVEDSTDPLTIDNKTEPVHIKQEEIVVPVNLLESEAEPSMDALIVGCKSDFDTPTDKIEPADIKEEQTVKSPASEAEVENFDFVTTNVKTEIETSLTDEDEVMDIKVEPQFSPESKPGKMDKADSETGAADEDKVMDVSESEPGSAMLLTGKSKKEKREKTSCQNSQLVRTDKRSFLCKICNEIVTSKRHQYIHTELPYKCNICNKRFRYKGNLNGHRKIHTGERSYMCDICGKIFDYNRSLKKHKQAHLNDGTVICDICNKGFPYHSSLAVHKLTHNTDYSFICDKCNRIFSNKTLLDEHRLLHNSESSYKCEICNKVFYKRKSLMGHLRKHVSSFNCDACDKAFSTKNSLKKHQIMHTGERPFQCDVCDKRFTQISHFRTHYRIHTGECPFKCDLCNKTFSRTDSLKKHRYYDHIRK